MSRSYRSFRGYDKDARRTIAKVELNEAIPYDAPEDKQYSAEVRYNPKTKSYEPRYLRPKEAAPLLDENGNPIKIDGEVQRDFQVDFDEITPDNARPAALTVRPTATTNYRRPYTVAAGWERYPRQSGPAEANLGTLTTLFRDGTLWNYYDVDRSFWIKFKDSFSKGQYINKHAANPELTNSYRNGPADLSRVSQITRDLIYTESRVAQYKYVSKRNYTYTNKATGERRTLAAGRVPKSAQNKLGKNPNQR
jgi:hypothetical protein